MVKGAAKMMPSQGDDLQGSTKSKEKFRSHSFSPHMPAVAENAAENDATEGADMYVVLSDSQQPVRSKRGGGRRTASNRRRSAESQATYGTEKVMADRIVAACQEDLYEDLPQRPS